MIENIKKFPQTITELERFIDTYQNKLVHHAFYRLGCKEDSEDIVQNVIVKLYNKKERYVNIENPITYVFKSVSNACLDYMRANKSNYSKINEDDVLLETSKDAHKAITEQEEYERVNKILERIPDEQAEILRLRIIDEMSFIEIAEVIGIPVTTAKSRFKYGIDKVKNILEQIKSK